MSVSVVRCPYAWPVSKQEEIVVGILYCVYVCVFVSLERCVVRTVIHSTVCIRCVGVKCMFVRDRFTQ